MVAFKHSVYPVGSSNIMRLCQVFWHLSYSELSWNTNPFCFFPSNLFVPCRLSRKIRILNITEFFFIIHSLLFYFICLKTDLSFRITMIRKSWFNSIPRIISSVEFAKSWETMPVFVSILNVWILTLYSLVSHAC